MGLPDHHSYTNECYSIRIGLWNISSIAATCSEARFEICITSRTTSWSTPTAATDTARFARRQKIKSSRAWSILSPESSQAVCEVCHRKKIQSQWFSTTIHSLSQASSRREMVAKLGRSICRQRSITPQLISANQCRWVRIVGSH